MAQTIVCDTRENNTWTYNIKIFLMFLRKSDLVY